MDICYYKYYPESENLSQICHRLHCVSPGGGQAHARGQLSLSGGKGMDYWAPSVKCAHREQGLREGHKYRDRGNAAIIIIQRRECGIQGVASTVFPMACPSLPFLLVD